MRTAIHQFVPMLHRDDAVGRHTLRIRDVLHQRGIQSNVYVEMIDPDTAADTKLFPTYDADAQRGDLLALPARHRLQHCSLAGRAPRDAGRQLPQRHPARALRRLEQPAWPATSFGRSTSSCVWRHGPHWASPSPSSTRPNSRSTATPAPPSCPRPPWPRRAAPPLADRHRRQPEPAARRRPLARRRPGRPQQGDRARPDGPPGDPRPPRPVRLAPGHRPPRRARLLPRPASASSTSSASARPSPSGARSATTTWSAPWPRPTCWSSPRSTRASECPSSRRWPWGSPSSPTGPAPCPRSWAMPASWSTPSIPTPWPTASNIPTGSGAPAHPRGQSGTACRRLRSPHAGDRLVDLLTAL